MAFFETIIRRISPKRANQKVDDPFVHIDCFESVIINGDQSFAYPQKNLSSLEDLIKIFTEKCEGLIEMREVFFENKKKESEFFNDLNYYISFLESKIKLFEQNLKTPELIQGIDIEAYINFEKTMDEQLKKNIQSFVKE
jgi:hypothetical protein